MLFKVIVFLIVIGVIFRFISKYVRPVFQVTSAASEHLRRMQEQMNQMNEQMKPPVTPIQKTQGKKEGDYIDYEEVK